MTEQAQSDAHETFDTLHEAVFALAARQTHVFMRTFLNDDAAPLEALDSLYINGLVIGLALGARLTPAQSQAVSDDLINASAGTYGSPEEIARAMAEGLDRAGVVGHNADHLVTHLMEVFERDQYCPCAGQCHATKNPCSMSCIGHDIRRQTDAVQ